MPTLPIPGGFSNKEAIDAAYLALGLNDSMFGRTAEEYASGLTLMRIMMNEWPFDQLGFDDSVASVSEQSNIEQKWLGAVSYALAARIGATIGKMLKAGSEKAAARTYSSLCAAVGNKSTVAFASGTARGSGHRFPVGRYFPESEEA
jgi:hypothetical protein